MNRSSSFALDRSPAQNVCLPHNVGRSGTAGLAGLLLGAVLSVVLPAAIRAAEYPHDNVPGVVINYSPAASGKYIGCPAIAILPDGQYVATHTFFGPEAALRTTLVFGSADLKQWKVHTIVLRHRDRRHHAWQYVDWRFDGDDIVAVSRTGWDDSHNFHDANYLTFHRIARFRELTMDDAAPWLPEP